MWFDKTICFTQKGIMKVKILLLITMFLFPSCSGLVLPRITPHKKGVDKAFKHHIVSYKKIIKNERRYKPKFKVLSMNFAELSETVVGRCWWLLNGDLEVEIDTKYWKMASFIDRQFLVYHELEHCIRGRLHTNKKENIENILDFFEEILYYLGFKSGKAYLKDGCPNDIMNTHTMGWLCQQKHYTYYLDKIKNYRKRGYNNL